MSRPAEFLQRNPIRIDRSRSVFEENPRWQGEFNSYELVPILTYPGILPGDSVKCRASMVTRMSTPLVPVMDDLWQDVQFYFVANKLILSRSYMSPSTSDSNHSWKAFIGAQDSLLNMPYPDGDIELPAVLIGKQDKNSSPNLYLTGGIADKMGMAPSTVSNYKVNCLSALAFMAVWNENFREPNTQNPGVFSITSGQVVITWSAVNLSASSMWSLAKCPNVCRFHGYFGSALPWPQRNSETILLPLGTTANVIADSSDHSTVNNIEFGTSGYDPGADPLARTLGVIFPAHSNSGELFRSASSASGADQTSVINRTNLVADLANASAVSINVFRLAVQEQRWYEALARGGNRLDEMTQALFGVIPHDSGNDQPEYLGGKRIPINVTQVNSTAATSDGKVGETGAFSLTGDEDWYFTKSFDTWGVLLGVTCIRYRDQPGFGVNRLFFKHRRFDFYFPQFANLGEMPVYKYELDANNMDVGADYWPNEVAGNVFGYQEAWSEYRTIPDVVTGLFRPGENLQHWTYAGCYTNKTSGTQTGSSNLGSYLQAVDASKAVDRTLIVSSSTSGFQFFSQFQFELVFAREMPTHSIPGLVDHH